MRNIASISIIEADIENIDKRLSNAGRGISIHSDALGLPGFTSSLSSRFGQARMDLSKRFALEAISDEDMINQMMSNIKAEIDPEFPVKGPYTTLKQPDGDENKFVLPGQSAKKFTRDEKEQYRLNEMRKYLEDNIHWLNLRNKREQQLLTKSPPPDVSGDKTAKGGPEGPTPYEIFMSQSAHELAIMKELGSSQSRILEKRRQDLNTVSYTHLTLPTKA